MNIFRLLIASLIFTGITSVSVAAQTLPAAKIALIDTQSFYANKGGITRILNGYTRLNAELRPDVSRYEAKLNQFNTLKKTYDTLVDNAARNIPVKTEDVQSKREQLTALQTEIKRMQEDIKQKQDKREAEILGPIVKQIGTSIAEYSKQKGYTIVLDIGRMSSAQMILYADQAADITTEFITFYNSKPAGAASN